MIRDECQRHPPPGVSRVATEERERGLLRPARRGAASTYRWKVTPWRAADTVNSPGLIIYAERITAQVETQRRLAEREIMIRDLFEHPPWG